MINFLVVLVHLFEFIVKSFIYFWGIICFDIKSNRIVRDLRVHSGTEENCVVTNGLLLGLR